VFKPCNHTPTSGVEIKNSKFDCMCPRFSLYSEWSYLPIDLVAQMKSKLAQVMGH
jgi:hypothetical protein